MQSNIKKLRKEKHISQTELGRVLGVSQQMISRIEKDRERIQIRQLITLSDYFGVSTDYVLNYIRKDIGLKELLFGVASGDGADELRENGFYGDDRILFYLFMCIQSYMEKQRRTVKTEEAEK